MLTTTPIASASAFSRGPFSRGACVGRSGLFTCVVARAGAGADGFKDKYGNVLHYLKEGGLWRQIERRRSKYLRTAGRRKDVTA